MRCRAERVQAGRTRWTAASRTRGRADPRKREARDFVRRRPRDFLDRPTRLDSPSGETTTLPRGHRRWKTPRTFDLAAADAGRTVRGRARDGGRRLRGRQVERLARQVKAGRQLLQLP